jgi:hypothetical protein
MQKYPDFHGSCTAKDVACYVSFLCSSCIPKVLFCVSAAALAMFVGMSASETCRRTYVMDLLRRFQFFFVPTPPPQTHCAFITIHLRATSTPPHTSSFFHDLHETLLQTTEKTARKIEHVPRRNDPTRDDTAHLPRTAQQCHRTARVRHDTSEVLGHVCRHFCVLVLCSLTTGTGARSSVGVLGNKALPLQRPSAIDLMISARRGFASKSMPNIRNTKTRNNA